LAALRSCKSVLSAWHGVLKARQAVPRTMSPASQECQPTDESANRDGCGCVQPGRLYPKLSRFVMGSLTAVLKAVKAVLKVLRAVRGALKAVP